MVCSAAMQSPTNAAAGTAASKTAAPKSAKPVAVGDPAPDFDLVGDDGKRHRLADYRGKRVILYFYPKDNTPGCTQEACDFRDHSAELGKAGAVVLGVSPDSAASHQKFKEKFALPFTLLVDEGSKLAAQYGAYGEKNMYGKKSMGIIRSTFIIEADGTLGTIYPRVSVKGHVDKVRGVIAGGAK